MADQQEPFIGIDFGTTNSKVAWINPRTGEAEILTNANNEDLTPSVVYFGQGETLVGRVAESRFEDISQLEEPERSEEMQRFVRSIKRRLGQPYSVLLPDGRRVSAVEVAAEIFRKLKRDAERHLEEPATRAVITHPAMFGPAQQEAITQAAKLAGFTQIRLLEEPVAAAIAYSQIGKRAGSGFLVYDFGGGTFDLAVVVRESDGSYHSAMEPDGDPACGGDDLDELLYGYWEEQVKRERGRPIASNGRLDAPFLRECRKRKENLSEQNLSSFQSILPGGVVAKLKIDRPTFVRLIEPVIDRTVKKTQAMLDKASARNLKIDSVILVGGSSSIPLVSEMLREYLKLEPHTFGRKDFAVPLGAAATTIKPREDDVDITSRQLVSTAKQMIREARFREAVPLLRNAIAKGDTAGMVELGDLYFSGLGVERSYSEAVAWFQKAAAAGNLDALACLAGVHVEGKGVPKDVAESVRLSRKAAEAGSARGMAGLSFAYSTGKGVSTNLEEAKRWAHRAIEAGSELGLTALAYAYFVGARGGNEDRECASWAFKGAEAGEPLSMGLLGGLYLEGRGVVKDEREAARWLHKSADHGVNDAMFLLGNMYRSGSGVRKDTAEGLRLIKRAAAAGSMDAAGTLGMIYLSGDDVPSNVPEGVRLLREAAESGNVEATHYLGLVYLGSLNISSDAIPREPSEGIRWLRKAAEAGHMQASRVLAQQYVITSGAVPQDFKEAATWSQKAAENGDVPSMLLLALLYFHGSGVPKDQVTAACWAKQAADLGEVEAMRTLGQWWANGFELSSFRRDLPRLGRSLDGWPQEALDGGPGVLSNNSESRSWFEKAAAAGDEESQDLLHRSCELVHTGGLTRTWRLSVRNHAYKISLSAGIKTTIVVDGVYVYNGPFQWPWTFSFQAGTKACSVKINMKRVKGFFSMDMEGVSLECDGLMLYKEASS